MYFVCITVGTVGYGEFAPKSQVGKITCIILIIFTGILIPTQISAYTDILSRETAFDKKYNPDKRIEHVLICGDVDNGSLSFFLHNWLYGEGGSVAHRCKVIILSPQLPSPSLHRILIHQDYEQHVVYLQGSAMDTSDLARACASTATACFVMTKKGSDSMAQWDTATNLITCSIRKANLIAPLTVQVSKIENMRHFSISGASSIACIEQLKLALIGKSLWIKGLNAFIGNLVQPFEVDHDSTGSWLFDYARGCGIRIYEAKLPTFLFQMITYRALAVLLYREFQVPVIGIRAKYDKIFTFPVDQTMDDSEASSILVLATSVEIVLQIERLTNAVYQRHSDIAPATLITPNNTSAIRALTHAFTNANGSMNKYGSRSSRHHSISVKPAGSGQNRSIVVPSASVHCDVGEIDDVTPTNDQPPLIDLMLKSSPSVKSRRLSTPRASNAGSPRSEDEPFSTGTAEKSKTTISIEPPSMEINHNSTGSMNDRPVQYPSSDTTIPRSPRIIRRSFSQSSNPSRRSSIILQAPSREHPNLRKKSILYRSFKRRSPPSDLTGHFVVCGIPSNYSFLIKNLADVDTPLIVFVTPREVSETIFNMHLSHQNQTIYFVRGSPLNPLVFDQARMLYAKGILIMANCGAEEVSEHNSSSEQGQDENMADVDAITTHRFISESCYNAGMAHRQHPKPSSGPYIIVEMMRPSNVKFLGERSSSVGTMTKSFSRYDERAVSNILQTREIFKDSKAMDESLFSPLYAGGHIYFTNFVDALLGASTHNLALVNMISVLIVGVQGTISSTSSGSSAVSGPKNRLTQIPAPAIYHNAPYGVLVEGLLMRENIMALGLYRVEHGCEAPAFVYTNPPIEEIVRSSDLVFVIK